MRRDWLYLVVSHEGLQQSLVGQIICDARHKVHQSVKFAVCIFNFVCAEGRASGKETFPTSTAYMYNAAAAALSLGLFMLMQNLHASTIIYNEEPNILVQTSLFWLFLLLINHLFILLVPAQCRFSTSSFLDDLRDAKKVGREIVY